MPNTTTLQDWVQYALNPSPLPLAVAIILCFTIPIFLHVFVFKNSGLTTLPSILLIGPSGSGKTSLLTLASLWLLQIELLLIGSSLKEALPSIPTPRKLP